jgi:hypothetical protein
MRSVVGPLVAAAWVVQTVEFGHVAYGFASDNVFSSPSEAMNANPRAVVPDQFYFPPPQRASLNNAAQSGLLQDDDPVNRIMCIEAHCFLLISGHLGS